MDPLETPTPAATETPPETPPEEPRSAYEEARAKLAAEPAPAPAEEDETPPEGEDQDGDEPAAAGEGEEEGGEEDEAGEGEDEGAEDELLVISLPGRRPGDEDLSLPLDPVLLQEAGLDPKQVENQLRQMRNGYARREELAEDRAALDEVIQSLATDPAGFIVEAMEPEAHMEVARRILLTLPDDKLVALLEHVDRWEAKPETRRTEALEAENKRLKERPHRPIESAHDVQVRQIGQAITGLIPEDFDDAETDAFARLAASKLKEYANEKKLTEMDPAEVPHLLQELGVLRRFGISLDEGAGEPAVEPVKPAAKAAAPTTPPKAVPPKKDARSRIQARRQAASAPSGQGSAITGFQRIAGESYEQRTDRLRKFFRQ